MDHEVGLLDRCCDSCTHSAGSPCKSLIPCVAKGPLCHESRDCAGKRAGRMRETKHGKDDTRISVCMDTCGLAVGAKDVYEAAREEVEKRALQATVGPVGCLGLCYAEPLMLIRKDGFPDAAYRDVKPTDVPRVLDEYLRGNVANAFFLRERTGRAIGEDSVPLFSELEFARSQVISVKRNCGLINPESIEEYIAYGGYQGLHRALKMQPTDVIEEIKKSGLRGRGGAGFPTWLKWSICRNMAIETRYAICNADEGDPGAFMNRLIAEVDPHRVIEGLAIAAYAIGAAQAFIFVRAEKRLMGERLQEAVKAAAKHGFIGSNILGSGFNLDVRVTRSAGAFVCGEETAMIAAIEGRRAMPRQRPPYPAEKGLFGKPTTINNVETLAHVATIMADGWEEFVRYGTERSKGTKVFCIVGSARRTGAAEVPIGTTIRSLVFEVAGGVREGRSCKAVQIGGPSGGCLPESMLDLPMDYESLQSAGAIMGSGGLVVIDDGNCIVDVARYFTVFTMDESCGKCFPCRMGTKVLYDTLTRIIEGEGTEGDLVTLQDVGKLMKDASLCALGQTAPNPVLSTLRYFPEEYRAHVRDKRCPAKVCRKLVDYVILPELCVDCGLCARDCPANAITRSSQDKHEVDIAKCIKCGRCWIACPRNAVSKR